MDRGLCYARLVGVSVSIYEMMSLRLEIGFIGFGCLFYRQRGSFRELQRNGMVFVSMVSETTKDHVQKMKEIKITGRRATLKKYHTCYARSFSDLQTQNPLGTNSARTAWYSRPNCPTPHHTHTRRQD